jgi:hypothetical protein
MLMTRKFVTWLQESVLGQSVTPRGASLVVGFRGRKVFAPIPRIFSISVILVQKRRITYILLYAWTLRSEMAFRTLTR